MGSKGLKAVAIKAKRNLNLHDPEGFTVWLRNNLISSEPASITSIIKNRNDRRGDFAEFAWCVPGQKFSLQPADRL